MKAPDKIPFPLKAPLKKAGRPKGSKNTPKVGDKVSFKELNGMAGIAELNRLKNLVARQDDLIAQMQDELKDQKNTAQVLRDECNQLDEKIDSYREIIKTILEITE